MTQLPVEEPRPFGEDISVLMLLSSGPKRQLIQAACFLVQLFPEEQEQQPGSGCRTPCVGILALVLLM